MQPLPNNDQFGFYSVGGFKTYSKLEAIEHSGKSQKPVAWNFNNDIFDKFDWSQEPPGSLDFWYQQRALQIRDKYDYIVLWYSGGADSHNVLMSFVKNNIFIDEIAQYHNLDGDRGNKQTFLNEEVFVTSAPLTQNLIQNNPVYKHTKHRLVDLSSIQIELFKKDNKWDYFYQSGMHLSPNNLAKSYIRETLNDYQSLTDQGKSVCFVYGSEKPMIDKKGNDWYVVFQDCLDNAVSSRTQLLNRDWEYNELFYWSASLPQLVAKQAHIVKRFLSQLTPDSVDNRYVASYEREFDEYGRRPINTWCASVVINQKKYQLLPDGLHRLIYPFWNSATIVSPKPHSLAYSPRDTWMFDTIAPDIGQKYYNMGLLHLRQLVRNASPDYWWEYKFDANLGIPYSGGMKKFQNKYRIA